MVKVIRKKDLAVKEAELMVTSVEPVLRTFALTRTMSVIEEEPLAAIKKDITIKFDEYGNPNVTDVNAGLAYDHRVTWLNFDLDSLLWHTDGRADDSYTDETRYEYYLFKLAFKNLVSGKIEIYEFDGRTFYVPRSITAPADLRDDFGRITKDFNYEVLLIIQEKNIDDPDFGNVEGVQETFVSKAFNLKIEKSSYVPNEMPHVDTTSFQLHSLTKPAIVCKLSDIGLFSVDRAILGNKEDDTISYFKLGEDVTAHLRGFNVFMRFEHEDGTEYYRQWEKTQEDEELDDYVSTNPHILWVPAEVTTKPGNWMITIIAYCGNFDINPEQPGFEVETSYKEILGDQTYADANANEEGEIVGDVVNTSEDYYFYVSKDAYVVVENNFLEDGHLKTGSGYGSKSNVRTSGYSNLTTEDGFIFATADDSILFGEEQ